MAPAVNAAPIHDGSMKGTNLVRPSVISNAPAGNARTPPPPTTTFALSVRLGPTLPGPGASTETVRHLRDRNDRLSIYVNGLAEHRFHCGC